MADGKCDMCGTSLVVAESVKFSPEQVRSAVRSGFRNRRAAEAMEPLGIPADFSYQSFLTLVNSNNSDWVVCKQCLPDLRTYIKM